MMIRLSRFSSAGERNDQSWNRMIGKESRIPRMIASLSSKKNGVSGSKTESFPFGRNGRMGFTSHCVTPR